MFPQGLRNASYRCTLREVCLDKPNRNFWQGTERSTRSGCHRPPGQADVCGEGHQSHTMDRNCNGQTWLAFAAAARSTPKRPAATRLVFRLVWDFCHK